MILVIIIITLTIIIVIMIIIIIMMIILDAPRPYSVPCSRTCGGACGSTRRAPYTHI